MKGKDARVAGGGEVATKGSIVHWHCETQDKNSFSLFLSLSIAEVVVMSRTVFFECVSEQRDLNLHERPPEINAPRNKSP